MLAAKNQLNLVSVELEGQTVTQQVINYFRTEGAIEDYQVHPSNKYVVVAACHLYVFDIESGDICAKTPYPPESINSTKQKQMKLEIDASGLYASVVTPDANIQIFEVGTGKVVSHVLPQFGEVSSLALNTNYEHFVVADKLSQQVKIFKIDEKMQGASRRVLRLMREKIRVWD